MQISFAIFPERPDDRLNEAVNGSVHQMAGSRPRESASLGLIGARDEVTLYGSRENIEIIVLEAARLPYS